MCGGDGANLFDTQIWPEKKLECCTNIAANDFFLCVLPNSMWQKISLYKRHFFFSHSTTFSMLVDGVDKLEFHSTQNV